MWVVVPTIAWKAVAVALAAGGGIYLSYRGYWAHKLTMIGRHVCAALVGMAIVSGGVAQIHNQWNEEHPKEQQKEAKPQTPDFKITILGGNIFEPGSRPDWTGFAMDVQIRNAGDPSIATDWAMTVTSPDGKTWIGQLTKPPSNLNLTGSSGRVSLTESDFSLERLASYPLRVNDPPVHSMILFYIGAKKSELMDPKAKIEISAADDYGKRYQATHEIGTWLSTDTSSPTKHDSEPTIRYTGIKYIEIDKNGQAYLPVTFKTTGGDKTLHFKGNSYTFAAVLSSSTEEVELQGEEMFWANFADGLEPHKKVTIPSSLLPNSEGDITIALGPEISRMLPLLKERAGVIYVGIQVRDMNDKVVEQSCLVVSAATNYARLCSKHNIP